MLCYITIKLLQSTLTKPFIEIKCLFMLASADASTEVFSFLLLLLDSGCLPSPSLSLWFHSHWIDFLSWNVKLKLLPIPILTDRYAHKVISVSLYWKICVFQQLLICPQSLIRRSLVLVFFFFPSLLLHYNENAKNCCCYFHCTLGLINCSWTVSSNFCILL